MPTYPTRTHIWHFEIPGGAVHVTWRLKAHQPLLAPKERDIVVSVIQRAVEFGCHLNAAVVMDDHVHVLFHPGTVRTSVDFVTSWKSNSSRLICREHARQAPLWQRDFYQRWIRHPGHLDICATYIRDNPRRKWPGITSYPWILP